MPEVSPPRFFRRLLVCPDNSLYIVPIYTSDPKTSFYWKRFTIEFDHELKGGKWRTNSLDQDATIYKQKHYYYKTPVDDRNYKIDVNMVFTSGTTNLMGGYVVYRSKEFPRLTDKEKNFRTFIAHMFDSCKSYMYRITGEEFTQFNYGWGGDFFEVLRNLCMHMTFKDTQFDHDDDSVMPIMRRHEFEDTFNDETIDYIDVLHKRPIELINDPPIFLVSKARSFRDSARQWLQITEEGRDPPDPCKTVLYGSQDSPCTDKSEKCTIEMPEGFHLEFSSPSVSFQNDEFDEFEKAGLLIPL